MAFTGTAGLVELPQAPGWDPRTGPTITRRWRGIQAMVESGAASLRAAGIRYQVDPSLDGGYWMLVGYYGAEETQPPEVPLADTWSLVGNDLEKSIWDHPKLMAEWVKLITTTWPFPEITNRAIAKLRGFIEAYVRGEDTVAVGSANYPIDLTIISTLVTSLGLNAAVFQDLIGSLVLGVESFSVSQFVLRHTLVIALSSSIRPALVNVGRIYTTPMLQFAESIPTSVNFELPVSGYWLKRTPTVEQTAADKWTITQEYWHADAYDPFVYDLAV